MSDRDARYSLDDPADSGYQDAYDDVEVEDVEDEDYPPEGGRRKRRGRSIPGCLAALVALALIAAGAYVAVTKGAEFIRDQFSTAADYPGPGRGKVTFEVQVGRHGRRHRPQPQGRRVWWSRSTRSSRRREASPTSRWATTSSRRRCARPTRTTSSATPPTSSRTP